MSRVPTLLASLALLSTFTGCAMNDDDIWMPPSGTGKADGVTLIQGSDIPSQYVVGSKFYLTGRTMASLRDVGALTGDADALAMRADGIIANLPANGRLEAAELVRMESPQIFATLFPNEQAALPALWPFLVAPEPNTIAVGAPIDALAVTEQMTEPGGLTPPSSIQITSLPAELQQLARRVQLVFNADSSSSTIQIADIDQVLADPQAFTPDEVNQLGTIKSIFQERAVSNDEAKLIVPKPGHTVTSATLGTMKLELVSDVALAEARTESYDGDGSHWDGALRLNVKRAATLRANAMDAIIVIDLDTGNELVVRGAENELPNLGVGKHVFERYVAGDRKESLLATLPAFAPGPEETDLDKYLDYKLELANNTPLVRNAMTTVRNASTITATYVFATSPTTTPNLDTTILETLKTPPVQLPTGRYQVPLAPGGTVQLDIYPNNVIMVPNEGGDLARLVFFSIRSEKVFSNKNHQVSFMPAENLLNYHGQQLPVLPAHRVN